MSKLIESGHFYTQAQITKYSEEAEKWLINDLGIAVPQAADYTANNISPIEIVDGPQPGNLLTNVGIAQMLERTIAAEQAWVAANCALAVGDTNTAAAAGNTDLAAPTNKYYRVTDTVTRSSQSLVFVSTFGTAVANFAWAEYAVVIPDTATVYTSGTSKQASYIILNRKVAALGTKTSAQSWVFTVTITIS